MRMKWIMSASVLSLAASLAACQPQAGQPSAPPSEAERQEIDQRVQAYYKKTANLPANVTIKVVDLAPAEVPGLLSANIEASNGTNTQKVPITVTRDGRYFVQGQLTDLTADPFKGITEKIALTGEPMRGNPNASVTIVEYSDFQCPFCGRAYHTLEDQVLKEYGDKVRLVFKNFPLSSIHPWADGAALASECARTQSPAAFWKMYDFLFQNQATITPANLKEQAEGVIRDAGLDVSAFDACYDNRNALDAVKADQQEANALGVRSTPTFFINGRRLEGAVPYENFKTVLDQALNPGGTGAASPSAPTPGVVQPG
jgi:protein-disulfide isomerase